MRSKEMDLNMDRFILHTDPHNDASSGKFTSNSIKTSQEACSEGLLIQAVNHLWPLLVTAEGDITALVALCNTLSHIKEGLRTFLATLY